MNLKRKGLICIFMLLVLSTLNAARIEQIERKGTLVLVTCPYDNFFYTQNNRAGGLDLELAQIIADDLGVSLEINMVDSHPKLVNTLKNGNGDIVISSIMNTDYFKNNLRLSEPYFVSDIEIIGRKEINVYDVSELYRKRAALPEKSSLEELVDLNIRNVKKVYENSVEEQISALISNNADFTAVLPYTSGKITGKYSELKNLGRLKDKAEFCVGASKDAAVLINRINKLIAKMRNDGSLERLINKYYP